MRNAPYKSFDTRMFPRLYRLVHHRIIEVAEAFVEQAYKPVIAPARVADFLTQHKVVTQNRAGGIMVGGVVPGSQRIEQSRCGHLVDIQRQNPLMAGELHRVALGGAKTKKLAFE